MIVDTHAFNNNTELIAKYDDAEHLRIYLGNQTSSYPQLKGLWGGGNGAYSTPQKLSTGEELKYFNYVEDNWYQFGYNDASGVYVGAGTRKVQLSCNGKTLIIDPSVTWSTHNFSDNSGPGFKEFYNEFKKAQWGTTIDVYIKFIE